jgi:dihydrofolate reductase
MKAILYMTTTVNGIIAKHDDSANFITPTESASYVTTVTNAGALIIGRRTYEILSTQPEFQVFLKARVKIVAVSHGDFELKDPAHVIAHSPKEALNLVKSFDEVIIAGGGKLDASFLDANLIDEIYLDVEPAIVSEGIPLFSGGIADRKLKFLGSKKLGENEIQLHYAVIRGSDV